MISNTEEAKDEIIRLQSDQIKKYLRQLETSISKEEFCEMKRMYELVISSPSYKVGKFIATILKRVLPVGFLRKLYYLVLAVKKA